MVRFSGARQTILSGFPSFLIRDGNLALFRLDLFFLQTGLRRTPPCDQKLFLRFSPLPSPSPEKEGLLARTPHIGGLFSTSSCLDSPFPLVRLYPPQILIPVFHRFAPPPIFS